MDIKVKDNKIILSEERKIYFLITYKFKKINGYYYFIQDKIIPSLIDMRSEKNEYKIKEDEFFHTYEGNYFHQKYLFDLENKIMEFKTSISSEFKTEYENILRMHNNILKSNLLNYYYEYKYDLILEEKTIYIIDDYGFYKLTILENGYSIIELNNTKKYSFDAIRDIISIRDIIDKCYSIKSENDKKKEKERLKKERSEKQKEIRKEKREKKKKLHSGFDIDRYIDEFYQDYNFISTDFLKESGVPNNIIESYLESIDKNE